MAHSPTPPGTLLRVRRPPRPRDRAWGDIRPRARHAHRRRRGRGRRRVRCHRRRTPGDRHPPRPLTTGPRRVLKPPRFVCYRAARGFAWGPPAEAAPARPALCSGPGEPDDPLERPARSCAVFRRQLISLSSQNRAEARAQTRDRSRTMAGSRAPPGFAAAIPDDGSRPSSSSWPPLRPQRARHLRRSVRWRWTPATRARHQPRRSTTRSSTAAPSCTRGTATAADPSVRILPDTSGSATSRTPRPPRGRLSRRRADPAGDGSVLDQVRGRRRRRGGGLASSPLGTRPGRGTHPGDPTTRGRERHQGALHAPPADVRRRGGADRRGKPRRRFSRESPERLERFRNVRRIERRRRYLTKDDRGGDEDDPAAAFAARVCVEGQAGSDGGRSETRRVDARGRRGRRGRSPRLRTTPPRSIVGPAALRDVERTKASAARCGTLAAAEAGRKMSDAAKGVGQDGAVRHRGRIRRVAGSATVRDVRGAIVRVPRQGPDGPRQGRRVRGRAGRRVGRRRGRLRPRGGGVARVEGGGAVPRREGVREVRPPRRVRVHRPEQQRDGRGWTGTTGYFTRGDARRTRSCWTRPTRMRGSPSRTSPRSSGRTPTRWSSTGTRRGCFLSPGTVRGGDDVEGGGVRGGEPVRDVPATDGEV